MTDQYLTVSSQQTGEGYYTEKRSKFLSFAHHVESADEVKQWVDTYRKRYYDARHTCYAYRLGPEGADSRANDDGEPSGTAGKPIQGQLVARALTDTLVVVVRYYGGVNLGTGGLVVAYREAAALALDNAATETRLVEEQVEYEFPYVMMNSVMRVVKELGPRIVAQDFDNTCRITLAIRRSEAQRLRERLQKLSFE